MARCQFAQWDPITGTTTGGSYTSGPFKIVHHTTEGSTYQGAVAAYAAHNSAPHFTVHGATIHQHIDTGVAARALKNAAGGVQTNRHSAIQIEVVGFAGQPKNPQTLVQVARLCRWIEQIHSVARAWPNGFPRPSHNGGDPGGHNRNPANWSSLGGHYGHCHVPENTHWDPGYSAEEVEFIMSYAEENTGDVERTPESLTSRSILAGEAPGSFGRGFELTQGQRAPDQSETATVGPFNGQVPRDSAGLVKNLNPNIVFENSEGTDDDRYMTHRLKEKTDLLASLVMQQWPGVRLRVTDAWDEGQGHAPTSRHYEGRAIDLTTFPKDRSKLGRLCGLAIEAGYDWVFYEDDRHIHASVIRDEDLHEALALADARQRRATAEDGDRDIISELRYHAERLEEEELQLEAIGTALTAKEHQRLREIGSDISRLESAIILLGPVFKR